MLRAFSLLAGFSSFFVLTTNLGAEVAPIGPPMTIRAAVDTALEKNPVVAAARESIHEVDAKLSQAYSTMFPTLSGSGTAYHRKDALNVGNPAFGGEPYNSYAFGFNLSQPLFVGGGISSELSNQRLEQDMRKLNVEIAERDLTLQVVQSFYGILLQERRIETLVNQLDVQKELLRTAERRYSSGLSQKLEVLQQRTQVALQEPKIAEARNTLKTNAVAFANLLVARDAREIRISGTLDPAPIDEVLGLTKKRDARLLELMKNGLAQDQLDAKKGVALAKHWPQLFGDANYARSSFDKTDLLDPYSTSWSFGFKLTVPIFSGLSSIAERRVFASQASQLEIERQRLEDQLALDQVKARKDLELSKTQIDSSKAAYDLAQQSLAEAKRTYRLGTSTYLQLYESEQKYVEASFAYDKARYDAIVAEAKYLAASGLSLKDFINWLSAPRK